MKKIFWFVLLLGAFAFPRTVHAQMNYTLFGFNGVANTALYHPSTIDSAKFVLGLPALSRFEFSTVQNFANLGLFSTSNDFQTEFEAMISGLDNQSSLRFHNHIDLFLMGMRFKRKTYLTFGAYQEAYAILSPPGQLLDMVYNGNIQYLNQTIDMSHTNVSGMAFGALHAGIAQQFGRRFTLGVRAKMISGLAAVQSDVRALDLTIRQSSPAPYIWEINSDFDIYTNADTVNYVSNLLNFVNYGFAFDFSADYRLTRRITLSGGMRDMGSINWSDEYSNLAQSSVKDFQFDGVEINLGSDTDIEEQINQLIDTLASPFNIVNQKGISWSSSLPSTSYAQVSFRLTPNQIISGNYFRHDFLGTPLSAYGVSYSGAFGRGLRLKGNLMIMDDGTQNWGAGVSLGNALQIYLAMDYVQNLTDINQFAGVSTAFGLNFTFGKQSRKSYEVSEREYWKAKRMEKREARKVPESDKSVEAQPEPSTPQVPVRNKSENTNEGSMDDIIYKSNMNNIPAPPTPDPAPAREVKETAPKAPVEPEAKSTDPEPEMEYRDTPPAINSEKSTDSPSEPDNQVNEVEPWNTSPTPTPTSTPAPEATPSPESTPAPAPGSTPTPTSTEPVELGETETIEASETYDPENTQSTPSSNLDAVPPVSLDSSSVSAPLGDITHTVQEMNATHTDSLHTGMDTLNVVMPTDSIPNGVAPTDSAAPLNGATLDSIPSPELRDTLPVPFQGGASDEEGGDGF